VPKRRSCYRGWAHGQPAAYLRRGADVLGGARVSAPDEFLDVLSEGGSGYHFFGRSAEKVLLVRQQEKAAALKAT
jgi:hypothetical protein